MINIMQLAISSYGYKFSICCLANYLHVCMCALITISYLQTCHSPKSPSCISHVSWLIRCIAHHCVQATWRSGPNRNIKLVHIRVVFVGEHDQRRLLDGAETNPVIYHHAGISSHMTAKSDPISCRVRLRGWISYDAHSQTCIIVQSSVILSWRS